MKTIKYLSMAALAFVGTMITSCSSDDLTENTQQQYAESNISNVETLTTTISMAGGETRALTNTGVKTFAEGETMAVIYNNGTSTVKAVSHALETGDIADGGKSATFTFDLETPNKEVAVTYIYPAAMAKADGTVNYDALKEQDGTLTSLAANLDYCTMTEAWDDGSLPTGTLVNQLSILALNLKDGSDITSGITKLTLSDGTNFYDVIREAAAGPIYVAIRPTADANIEVTATDGTEHYKKSLTGKTYVINNGYNINWNMTKLPTGALYGRFTINDGGDKVYFSRGNLQYTKSTSTWSFMENQYTTVEANSQNVGTDYASQDIVSLFGWATGASGFRKPWMTSTSYSNYYAYGNSGCNLYDEYGTDDWGYNAISNGGNTTNQWRTLTIGEWRYLFNNNSKFGYATVAGTAGIILLPDGFIDPKTNTNDGSGAFVNADSQGYKKNIYTAGVNWDAMEAAGAVFLPAAGWRDETVVKKVNINCYYWSSTTKEDHFVYALGYTGGSTLYLWDGYNRSGGESVRLVSKN